MMYNLLITLNMLFTLHDFQRSKGEIPDRINIFAHKIGNDRSNCSCCVVFISWKLRSSFKITDWTLGCALIFKRVRYWLLFKVHTQAYKDRVHVFAITFIMEPVNPPSIMILHLG